MRIAVLALNVIYVTIVVIGMIRSHRWPDVDVLLLSIPFVAALAATFTRTDGWFAFMTSAANLVVAIAIGYFAWMLIERHSPGALNGPPLLFIAGFALVMVAAVLNTVYLFTRFMKKAARK